MHPAFSVIFLTTLIGAGQGLFLALYSSQVYGAVNMLPLHSGWFYGMAAVLALVLLVGGLIASFFHLGHPERAWRAASQWRTSWLSREVIALPLTMGLIVLYALANLLGAEVAVFDSDFPVQVQLLTGSVAVVATLSLYLCTGMIYAGIKFLQEWATPLTPLNYFLLGTASGFSLAAVIAVLYAPDLLEFYAGWALVLTVVAAFTRLASLLRNAHLKPRSSLQSAIGARHTQVRQRAMGMMGGSYNTREYFHGRSRVFLKSVKWIFLLLTFPVPAGFLWIGFANGAFFPIFMAFVIQYVGLLFERWFFFAQANHPQNLYYHVVG